MNGYDISWLNLFFGTLTLAIPILIFQYCKAGLTRQLLISFGRMIIQLLFVGMYLSVIFKLNLLWLNSLWVLIMMFAAAATIIKRSELNSKIFLLPVTLGIVCDLLVNLGVYTLIVMPYDVFLNAGYMIPIIGMVVGNCIVNTIISLRTFVKSIRSGENEFRYRLICGGSRSEVVMPFIAEALKTSFSPTIASNATIGLIWLPGMMTGQILAGNNPTQAIKYQMLIIISIFVGSVLTSFVSLLYCRKMIFDEYDVARGDVFAKK